MTSSPVPAPESNVASPLPWYRIWIRALTEPREATYAAISQDAAAGVGRAVVWVFLASTLGGVILFGAFVLLVGAGMLDPGTETGGSIADMLTGSLILVACVPPFMAVFSVLGLLVSSGISHALARALGGIGEYHRLAYTMAAYSAPASLLGSVTALIPCVNYLGIVLSVYLLYLNVLTIRAVHRLSWGRALLSSSLFIGVALATVACVLIVILALLGPAIGNVFSNIVADI